MPLEQIASIIEQMIEAGKLDQHSGMALLQALAQGGDSADAGAATDPAAAASGGASGGDAGAAGDVSGASNSGAPDGSDSPSANTDDSSPEEKSAAALVASVK